MDYGPAPILSFGADFDTTGTDLVEEKLRHRPTRGPRSFVRARACVCVQKVRSSGHRVTVLPRRTSAWPCVEPLWMCETTACC